MQLLKQFSPAFALLSTMQRSVSLPHLLLPNDEILALTASHPPTVVTVLTRTLEELLTPLRRLRADQAEFSCLKVGLILLRRHQMVDSTAVTHSFAFRLCCCSTRMW